MDDVLVIGGGVIGLSCALRLASAGASVTVVDDRRQGRSSRIAAGILFPNGTSRSTGPIGELNFRALDLWPTWENFLGGQLRRRSGLLQLADSDETLHDLKTWEKRFRGATDVEFIDIAKHPAGDLLGDEAKESVIGALELSQVCSINPMTLLTRLEETCRDTGVSFHYGEVLGLLEQEDRVTGVQVNNGDLYAGIVVGACGASNWDWLSQDRRPLLTPVQGERVIVETATPLDAPIIGTPNGSIVPRRNNQVWAGVTVREDNDGRPLVGAALQVMSNAVKGCPQLAQARLVELDAGIRPVSDNGLPFVGKSGKENLYLATGHGRDGILQSPLAAEQLVSAVSGQG